MNAQFRGQQAPAHLRKAFAFAYLDREDADFTEWQLMAFKQASCQVDT